MLLADEFFLITHSDTTGNPRLHRRGTGLGLAAALLGELALFGNITIQDGRVYVVDRQPPVDALTHTTLAHLVAEPRHQAVKTWLAFLGRESAEVVGQRLLRNGHVWRDESRRWFRPAVRYIPADMNTAAWPAARLRTLLIRFEPISLPDVVLAGLVVATGLSGDVLWDVGADAQRYLQHLFTCLSPPFHELLAHTQAAVGDSVLAHRA